MIQRILRILPILALVGLFISCGTTDPNIREAKSLLGKQNYQAALDAVNTAIEQDSTNANGWFYKAVIQSELAKDKDPKERRDIYKDVRGNLMKAEKLYANMEDPPEESNRIQPVLQSIWGVEHNRAVEIATTDSLRNALTLDPAVEHLKNATILQPDSALSFEVLAQVQQMNGNYKGAIKAYEDFFERADSISTQYYITLGQLYNNEKQHEDALRVLNEGYNEYPTNENLIGTLADTYNMVGNTDKALSTVKKLIEQNPENPQYHLVYGTTLYQTVINLTQEVEENYNTLFDLDRQIQQSDSPDELMAQIDSLETVNDSLRTMTSDLVSKASKSLKKVTELQPDNPKAYYTLGVIHQNRAIVISKERARTADNEKAEELNQKARDEFKQAMNYYEKATELEPDNQQYWRDLFRVYTNLGMNEKAEEAMKKAGME